MKVKSLTARIVRLPFRFAFKHNLASRDYSDNIFVEAAIEHDGKTFIGYGESIPREYVTGEDAQSAAEAIRGEYSAQFLNHEYTSFADVARALKQTFSDLSLDKRGKGASWCALELALLDAAAKAENRTVAECLGGVRPEHAEGIEYGGVIPFGKKRAFTAVLWFYKFFGFRTIKIKVGRDFDGDVERLEMARKVLGPEAILRVDANCAWNAQETIERAETFRRFKIASYEQPVPADDLEGLALVTRSIPEHVMADESLSSIEQARLLAKEHIVTTFNIRVSKVGGLLAAAEIAEIARAEGLTMHMGAQVGESGILSGAGRCFASTQPRFDNCEGSNNFFLLKQDITKENLNVGPGGKGALLKAPGLGVTVIPSRLAEFERRSRAAVPAMSGNEYKQKDALRR